jgi:DNA-binding NtrC family response regulator
MPAFKTLIVLEDDPAVRDALCLVLSDWEFRPLPAASASQALTDLAAAPGRVVAIITDFDLGGGLDGVSESKALLAAGVAAPVLVVSGSMGMNALSAAREAGFGFMPKPVVALDIRRWLDAALGKAA